MGEGISFVCPHGIHMIFTRLPTCYFRAFLASFFVFQQRICLHLSIFFSSSVGIIGSIVTGLCASSKKEKQVLDFDMMH